MQEALTSLRKDNLTEVDLSHQQLTDSQLTEIIALLSNQPALESLDLSHNKISGNGARLLASFIAAHPRLIRIDLGYNQIDDRGCQEIAKALSSNDVLQECCLESNPIKDPGANALASTLQTNRTLVKLILNGTQIKSQGVAALIMGLQANYTLVELSLGTLAIDSAIKVKVMELCKRNEAEVQKFLQACRNGDIKTIDELIGKGLSQQTIDRQGNTGLHAAAKVNQERVINHLLNLGAQPVANKNGETPLQAAQQNGHIQLAKQLGNRAVDYVPQAKNLRELREKWRDKNDETQVSQNDLNELSDAIKADVERSGELQKNLTIALERRIEEKIQDLKQSDEQLKQDVLANQQLVKEIEDRLEKKFEGMKTLRTKNLEAQITAMQKQIEYLTLQQEELSDLQKDKIERIALLKELEKDKNKLIFYSSICNQLQAFFNGCATVSSKLVDPSAGSVGDAATMVEVIGNIMSFAPIVGNMAGGVASLTSFGLGMIDGERQVNRYSSIAEALNARNIKKISEGIAKKLVESFAHQISLLKVDDDSQVLGLLGALSHIKDKLGKAILKSTKPSASQEVANYCMLKMIEALSSGDVKIPLGSLTFDDLIDELFLSVTKPLTDSETRNYALSRKFGGNKITTTDNRTWYLQEIFTKPGIEDENNNRHANDKANVELYGYRKGTYQEAMAHGYVKASTAIVGGMGYYARKDSKPEANMKPAGKTEKLSVSNDAKPTLPIVAAKPPAQKQPMLSPKIQPAIPQAAKPAPMAKKPAATAAPVILKPTSKPSPKTNRPVPSTPAKINVDVEISAYPKQGFFAAAGKLPLSNPDKAGVNVDRKYAQP